MTFNKNKKKLAIVIKTSGLDYDDRVRKEALSIKKLYTHIDLKIFAVVPDNRNEEGITSYGIPYELVKLKSRDKYKSASHLIAKSWDFYKTLKPKLKNFDYVWCGDTHTFMLVLMNNKPTLWDLHELPLSLINNKLKKFIYKQIEKKAKILVHANEARKHYLLNKNLCSDAKKHFYLNNFPSFEESSLPLSDIAFEKFKNWKENSECVYLQGLDGDRRAAYESISAILDSENLKGVVVGNFDNKIKQQLIDNYGEEVGNRIFFTGMVKQLMTPIYINECNFSLIFYKNISPNNWYCEANRFYQCIVNGLPVIVGANPSMKDIVEKYNLGIALKSDGSDKEEIKNSIKNLRSNYSTYKIYVGQNKDLFKWESQGKKIKQIMDKFLN